MTKVYKTDPKPPSELFTESIPGCGSDEMECGWCQRVHLCPDNRYAERHEDDRNSFLNYCNSEKEKNPDGIVLHYDCDSVRGIELNSIVFVVDCPCNGLARFEKFIWADRHKIRSYLKARIDHEYSLAQQEKTFNAVAGIDKTDSDRERHWF